jgi:hypothetical protein
MPTSMPCSRASAVSRRPPIHTSRCCSPGLAGWLARGMREHRQTQFRLDRLQPSWLAAPAERRTLNRCVRLAVGLGAGLIGGLGTGLAGGLTSGLAGGLFVGLAGGMLAGSEEEIRPVEALSWSWPGARAAVHSAGGLAAGLAAGLPAGLAFGWIIGLASGLVGGLAGGLVIGLQWGLVKGLSPVSQTPNEGIRRSARHAVAVWLASGLVGGSIGGLASELVIGLVMGLVGGLAGGLIVGLEFGGLACVQHLVLRALLARAGCAPWRYVHFLDYAADRVLLRRVGGAYEFIHPLLLEHLAAMPLHPSGHGVQALPVNAPQREHERLPAIQT